MTLSFSTKINGKPNYFIEKILKGIGGYATYYPAVCQDCGWKGMSSLCRGVHSIGDSGDYTDPLCPKCSSNGIEDYSDLKLLNDGYYLQSEVMPKFHTIREDTSNRWRAGMDIHMVINNRTKNRFQFAPVVKCVSVQEIEITDESEKAFPTDYLTEISVVIKRASWEETFYLAYSVKVDGKALSAKEVSELAIHDGFDSVGDFFASFNKDFKGKLIHWTDIKY